MGADDDPRPAPPRPTDAALALNRVVWDLVNAGHTHEAAELKWRGDELTWGLFDIAESELGALSSVGDVGGRTVVELGSGTSWVAARLARRGATVVALDPSHAQLCTAAWCQAEVGPSFPLVEADAQEVPLRDACCDLVVSEYGAGVWCDPVRWVAEAARILRPGGHLVFLVNSVLAALCVPEEGGFAGPTLARPQSALGRIAWPDGGVEHHVPHGEWVRVLTDNGFVVDALHELYAPPGAAPPEWYEIVDVDWARRWPAEDLWVARLG